MNENVSEEAVKSLKRPVHASEPSCEDSEQGWVILRVSIRVSDDDVMFVLL